MAMSIPLTDDRIIGCFVRFDWPDEGEGAYGPWPGCEKPMSQANAERTLDECVRLRPDFDFPAHRVRVREQVAADAIARARNRN
jgi:hypothetical protein